jgi:PiT family inorganic phosphate transporter
MAFSHGSADAQKSMGVITMALVSYATCRHFTSRCVMISCAVQWPLEQPWEDGNYKDGGAGFRQAQPVHGFCVETASAGVILGAAASGDATSTTYVITSSILE